jgi:predicted negative regulator of RcsB-dependent stress response
MAPLMAKQQQPKRLGAPSTEADKANELVDKYIKLLRDYQNVVFAVVVLVLTVGVLSVWQHQRTQEQDDAAWSELGKTKDHDAEKLEPIVKKFEGTNAHPYLVLALTSKLYERGEKADLEKAKALLERTRDEVSGNKLMNELVDEQLKGVRAELGDAKLWSGTAPVGSGSK